MTTLIKTMFEHAESDLNDAIEWSKTSIDENDEYLVLMSKGYGGSQEKVIDVRFNDALSRFKAFCDLIETHPDFSYLLKQQTEELVAKAKVVEANYKLVTRARKAKPDSI